MAKNNRAQNRSDIRQKKKNENSDGKDTPDGTFNSLNKGMK